MAVFVQACVAAGTKLLVRELRTTESSALIIFTAVMAAPLLMQIDIMTSILDSLTFYTCWHHKIHFYFDTFDHAQQVTADIFDENIHSAWFCLSYQNLLNFYLNSFSLL